MSAHTLNWSHGEAVVLSTAAVLADCLFNLPTGPFRPFARAPWMGTVSDKTIIGHLRELGGDFVCVPFGSGPSAPIGPPEWASLIIDPPFLPIHGPAGDAEWQVIDHSASSVTLALDYPTEAIVERLERTVTGVDGLPMLQSSLTIIPRDTGKVSVGLHPILRLPDDPGRLELTAEFDFGLIHPRHARADESMAFDRLDAVPIGEGLIDLSHVPVGLPNASAQLCGMRGPLRAVYLDEGAGIELDWDRAILPSLQIWCTDRGIDGEPWNGAYRGIGVEPIASAFDLNTALSERDNPISERDIATAVTLERGNPLVVKHSVRAFVHGGVQR